MMSVEALDLAGGLICGATAFGLFTIHVVSSRDRIHWVALPEPLRWSVAITGWLMAIRSVSLLWTDTPVSGQHIPPFAVLTALSVACTVCGFAAWIVGSHFPGPVWDRFAFAMRREREDPSLIPLVLSREDVTKAAEAQGFTVIKPHAETETQP